MLFLKSLPKSETPTFAVPEFVDSIAVTDTEVSVTEIVLRDTGAVLQQREEYFSNGSGLPFRFFTPAGFIFVRLVFVST